MDHVITNVTIVYLHSTPAPPPVVSGVTAFFVNHRCVLERIEPLVIINAMVFSFVAMFVLSGCVLIMTTPCQQKVNSQAVLPFPSSLHPSFFLSNTDLLSSNNMVEVGCVCARMLWLAACVLCDLKLHPHTASVFYDHRLMMDQAYNSYLWPWL